MIDEMPVIVRPRITRIRTDTLSNQVPARNSWGFSPTFSSGPAPLAQWLEQWTFNPLVQGSSPWGSTHCFCLVSAGSHAETHALLRHDVKANVQFVMKLKHLAGRKSGVPGVAGHALVAALVLGGILAVPVTSSASDSSLTSEQVADEILRVQGQADQTAKRWALAQQQSQDLAIEIAAQAQRVAETSANYDALDAQMTQIAVSRFTEAAGGSLLFFVGDPNLAMQISALSSVALDAGATDLDSLDAARSDLNDEQASLDALNVENAQLVADLAARQVEIDGQLVALASLREHLKVEEVKRAFDAKVAEQRREEAAAAEKRAAQAAAKQQASPTLPARGGGAAAPPAKHKAPSASTPPVISGGSWPCPVAGPNAFGDTWGAPRSGGRKHEGVDMMSPAGTPVVAVVAGSAVMKTANLGGNVIWLAGVDGNSYFYGHLSAWEGTSRTVSTGEVIGYVGATGNTTANHLHFGIYPGGGAAVNPYPIVRQHC